MVDQHVHALRLEAVARPGDEAGPDVVGGDLYAVVEVTYGPLAADLLVRAVSRSVNLVVRCTLMVRACSCYHGFSSSCLPCRLPTPQLVLPQPLFPIFISKYKTN